MATSSLPPLPPLTPRKAAVRDLEAVGVAFCALARYAASRDLPLGSPLGRGLTVAQGLGFAFAPHDDAVTRALEVLPEILDTYMTRAILAASSASDSTHGLGA